MLYSILIFGIEGVFDSLPEAEQQIALDQHRALQERLEAEGTYRGSVQLMPPSTAAHIVADSQSLMVMDGPFLESKEHFLGFYMIECDELEYALNAAKELPQRIGHMEVRAVAWAEGLRADGK